MADGDPPVPVDDIDSQPELSNGESTPILRRLIERKLTRNVNSKDMEFYHIINEVMHKNIAEDILSFSVDEIDIPYMLLSVIGDSPEFHPKEWSKLSFQTAILETVNRAEECLVMYMQPGSGAMIGTLVENTLKNHSIGVDRFLTFRYRKTENDTFNNPMDTGLCLYSHKLMSVCDLRSSRSVMKRKIPKPDHESISNIMFEIEKYIHEVGRIEIEFVREVDKVPVVLVLAEGDMTSIHHVLEAVKIDTIVYIIKGSGKAADVIADYLNDQNSLEESVAKHFGLAFLKEEEKLKQLKQYLNKIIEKYRWKITVFDINKEEPKVLADMISDSVSSLWKLDPTKQFEDGYMWIPNIYIPLAYRYIQLHGEFGSHKASSLLEQAFRVSANIVKRLLDNGTSLRKIYEQEQDTYVYSPTIKETPVKSPLSSFTAVSSRKEDKVNNYRRRLQFLRGYCRRLVGYTTGTELIIGSSPDMSFERASKGYMSEELLSELFMFEFLLSNDHEMADIFWHRCPNQLMTALVMSAFLKKKAKVELELRKRRLGTDLMNMSKSFEARATYILDRMYNVSERDETQVDDDNDEFTTEERFTEDPVDEEFRILSEPVNVMGLEITPLEFAFNNERLDFLSHSTCQRYLLTQWTAKNKKAVNCMEQVWKFMAAPRTKFYVSYVFFFLAMICCSIFTLTDVNLITSFSEISKYQIAFTIWIVGDLFEEFVVELFLEKWERQVQSVFVRIKHWMRDLWNWLDTACYYSYTFGVVSHYLSTDPQTLITRRLYTLTVVFMYLRFLRVMLMSKNIGTKVIMIAYMTKDLLSFLRILAIIIIGVGVGYHANIFPNFSPLFYDDWGERWMDARIFSIIAMPYWQIYGDPNLNDLENEAISYCESKNITSDCKMDFSVPLTSFVFMMFGNVLLMNLVIAMFSNRFSAVESNSERVWNYRFSSIVIEYRTRLPSPINLIIRPIQILFYPCRNLNWCKTRKIGVLEKSYLLTGSEHKYQNVTPDGIDSSTTSFQFRIQTNGDVYVGLFCYPPDQREGEMIEIMISRDNSKGAVITNRKKDILVTKDTENILDKSSFREFEITWSEKEMQVESRTYTGNAKDGYIPQKKKIIKATCKIKDINCVAYHTSNHSAGVWKFKEGKNKKDLLNIYKGFNESSTPEKKGYRHAKFFDLDKNETSVIFKVKAKCDVHLAFFKKSENEKSLHELAQDDFEMMKVVIGGSANTKTWISYTNCRKVNDSREIKKSTPLNDISNSEQQKTSRFSKNSEPFWISWGEMMGEETVVKVGKGEDVDIKPILKGQLPPFKVEFIGVSTSEQSEGNWTFDTGKTIFTPKEFNYKLVSPVIMEQFRKTITFQVKAKSDAHIALCHKLPSRCDKNMYEIVLDHNKTSFIRNLSHDKNNKKILAKRDGCCLNEKTYTTFWISWADGKIKVGKSTLYNEEILSCEYGYEYPVVYLAVSTGPESYGYWRFDEDIIFNAVKHMKTSLPSEIQEMQRKIFNINDTRQTIWQYNNDEVKKKRMKLKWRRSQEQLSAVCINSLQNEMSNNRSETE